MELAAYFAVAIALASVPFSWAVSTSVYRCIVKSEMFAMAAFAAFFQGLLFLLGWLAGSALSGYFNALSYPVSIVVLLFIGIRMFSDARRKGAGHRTYTAKDYRILAAFSLAMGVNAFLVAISLGLIKTNLQYQISVLIVITFIAVITGVRIGGKGKIGSARRTESVGSAILILLVLLMLLRYVNIL